MLKNIECCRLLVLLGKYQIVELDKNSLSLLGLDFSVFRWLFICAFSSRSCRQKMSKKDFQQGDQVSPVPSADLSKSAYTTLSFSPSFFSSFSCNCNGKIRLYFENTGCSQKVLRHSVILEKKHQVHENWKTWGVQATLKLQILG